MSWPLIFRSICVRTSLILVIMGGLTSFFLEPRFITGILIGGILSLGNLYVMQDNIVRIFTKSKGLGKAKFSVIGKFYLRLVLLGLLIYMLLKLGIQPVALAMGFGSLVVGIISLAVISIKETGEAM